MVAMLKSALLIAGISGIAVSAQLTPQQLSWYRTQLTSVSPQSAPPSVAADPLAEAVVEWKKLQQSDNYPFAEYASFLTAHPAWPGETGFRKAAESALDRTGGASPSVIVGYFKRYPPLTGAGAVRYAQALLLSGDMAAANEVARTSWTGDLLSSDQEATLLGGFAGAIRSEDQDSRMDMLLWRGATAAAQRQIALVSPVAQPQFAARLAYLSGAADAEQRGSAPGVDRNDPGFIAARATWLRDSSQSPAARAYLAQPRHLSAPPRSVASWYKVLLTNASAAAADGQYGLAFSIASQVDDAYPPSTDLSKRPYAEKDAYTDLVWLAGQTALQHLGRAHDAVALFDRYSRPFPTPQTRSKGLYWAGRAAMAAGERETANGYFGQAVAFSDSFYGQLAAEQIGQPLRAPIATPTAVVPQSERDAFYARETVRAAQMLGTLGDHDDQTAFVRQIALNATSDSDHRLGVELSRSLARPDLGVMISRSALQNGLDDYMVAGYPTVAVPETEQPYWTMIHAIARQESQFDRAAQSHAGALGLMQLMPGTAREVSTRMGLSYDRTGLTGDPSYNIRLGSTYFQRMFGIYGSYPMAVAAYNAGPGNVNKWLAANGDPRSGSIDMVDWIEAIPIHETRGYVQRVLENAVVYDLLNPQRAKSRGPDRLDWYLGRKPR